MDKKGRFNLTHTLDSVKISSSREEGESFPGLHRELGTAFPND
jgi:hypothetical protein